MTDPWARRGSSSSGGNRPPPAPVIPPRDLPAYPDARRAKPKTPRPGGGMRTRWKDAKTGRIYEWDYDHGRVEVYDSQGYHLGEFDPQTGQQTKPRDPARRVEP